MMFTRPESEVIQIYQSLQEQQYHLTLPSDATYIEYPLHQCSLTYAELAPLTSVRTSAIAKKIPNAYMSVVYIISGHGTWFNSKGFQHLAPGQLLFFNAASEFTFHFSSRYQVVSFNFPEYLLPRLPTQGFAFDLVHEESQVLRLALTSVLAQVRAGVHSEELTARFLEQALLAPLIDCVSAYQQKREASVSYKKLCSIQQLIFNASADDNFTIEALCDNAQISKRYLHKLFAMTPYHANDFIYQTRLIHGFQLMVTQNNQHLSILDIAIHSGFKSQAHFSRLFKRTFALTPSALLSRL
ncbi:helix-turn-helix transcriptional regulator [Colwellia sp. D2M02]|uniref:helix-turn-helix transcriptional regulator n=1 Tax=Colwellia sp. D2M02 TaxID=2841562 RepID=UPI001C09EB75|nr:AraC family transcriptional regulator [Colwellia sp. D2M02]MBU2892300.1 helix-turn-helix transcriptional regulator [Colwellia sp. D2M02]